MLGAGTPRELKNRAQQLFLQLLRFPLGPRKAVPRIRPLLPAAEPRRNPSRTCHTSAHSPQSFSSSATGC
jgi:hypothetical protein